MEDFYSLYSHDLVRIASCVPRTKVADVSANLAETIRLANAGSAAKAAIMVFPELGLSSYAIEDLLFQDALLAAVETAIDELRRSGEASAVLADTSFGDTPVAVLTHGVPFPDASQERAWQESQAEMAARSSRGRLITAPGAGHSIMIGSPGLVTDTLAEIVSLARPSVQA